MLKMMKAKTMSMAVNMLLVYQRLKEDMKRQEGDYLFQLVLLLLILGILAILIYKGFGESLAEKAREVRDNINGASTPSF